MSDNQESEIKNHAEKKAAYNEKRSNKIDRYETLAKKASKESESRFKAADKIAQFIPMGQPILVGHHSEKHHRRDLKRIDDNMRKGIKESDKAQYYAEKAQATINNYAISSSDPDAVKLLKEKLAKHELFQEHMKKVNKEYKKYLAGKVSGIPYKWSIDFTDEQIKEIIQMADKVPSYEGNVIYPKYRLTNNNAVINTTRKRIDQLQKFAKVESSGKYTPAGLPDFIQFEKDTIENRFKVYMPKKFYQGSDLKDWFKKHGWRYSPTNVCHQRQLNTIGWAEKEVLDKLKKLVKGE